MKNFWTVIQLENEKGERYSHAWKFSSHDNVMAFIEKEKGIDTINICETKKQAEELANLYNERAKANGNSIFTNAPF